jgi:hypothetical protein
MADYIFPNLTTAVAGINTSVNFLVQSTASYTISVTNGTVSIGNVSRSGFNILTNTTTAIPPRRPTQGQLYPRGVYNK